MPRLRLGLGALFAAVATLVAMVCLPAVASAAVNISILSAGPDSTGNPYDLTVVADDGNGLRLTSAAAHVFNSSNQELPGSPYSMSYVSGAPSAQTWAATTPIPQADLPPGTYTVTVDASDAFPETDPGLPAPAPFSFSYTTKMTVTANPPTVTQGSQNVTFTGTVTGVAPGGTPVGLANVPVNLAGAPGNPVATTASDGSFTCPASTCQATGITQTTTYAFSVAADPGGTYSAASSSVTVSAQQATTAISVTANPTSVSEGSPGVMFTGNVTVTPQGSTTTTGIGSAVPVDVSINGVSVGQVLTSDASGDFTYSADPISATTTYTFSVAATPLYTGVSSSVIIQANQAQTAIAVTPSPAFVTLGSQAVTFSGTVTALPPGGTTAVPVPGADVFVNGGTTRIATTDSSGRFTYQVSGISQSTSYTFSVNQANLYSAATDQVTIPLDPAHTEMIATANPADVHLGSSTVIFSGTVTVTPAGGSTAGGIGSGVPVDLSVNGGPATQVTTTDDAKGDFTDKITGITKAADYNFSVNAAPFWSAATADVPIGLQQLAANLVVTPGRVSVTEGSQSVTFSGVLSGTVPGSTVVVDIPNAPVYLDGGTTKIATTDKNGAFHYVIGGISKASSFNFSVTGTPTTYSNATDDVPIAVTPAPTRITGIAISPAQLKYGEKATLTGTVQYRSGTSWTALSGVAVHLFEGKTGVGTVSAGKAGSFKATLPTIHGAAWRATLSAAALFQQASAIGNLSISVPMRTKSFSAILDVLGSIKATGCLQVTVPVRYGPESKIEIQYAAGSHGPWKELGKLQLHNVAGAPALCRDANESYFGGSIRAKLANAYYRAYFAGYVRLPAHGQLSHPRLAVPDQDHQLQGNPACDFDRRQGSDLWAAVGARQVLEAVRQAQGGHHLQREGHVLLGSPRQAPENQRRRILQRDRCREFRQVRGDHLCLLSRQQDRPGRGEQRCRRRYKRGQHV